MKEKRRLSKSAGIILRINLPILTLSLITILISYLIERESAPITATLYHRGMLEYIFSALAMTVGGGLLAEMAEQEQK